MDRITRFKQGEKVTWVGLIANILLAVFKGYAGIVGFSQAMIADAVESVSDIAATFMVLVSLRVSKKPRDIEHPYGHYKSEPVAAAAVGFIIFLGGIGILVLAISTIITGKKQAPTLLAFWAAVITIVYKEGLYQYTIRIGQRINSAAVIANAWDHRKDALTTVATLLGIAGAHFLGIRILDPIAAIIVSIFIFRIGLGISWQSLNELMDISPPKQILSKIRKLTMAVPGVEHVSSIRARKSGPYILVDLKIKIDSEMSVAQSHFTCGAVKHTIMEHLPDVMDIMIHVNPHVRHN